MVHFQPDRSSVFGIRSVSYVRGPTGHPAATASPTVLWEESPARQRGRAAWTKLAWADEHGRIVTATQIQRFLASQGSPMKDHAENIVFAGNRYGVDPRLIVAIAGVESSFGKKCNAYNAWGWNNGRTRWRSWSQSIDQYTRALSENYPSPRIVRKMAPAYNPNTPDSWGSKVLLFMASIDHPSGAAPPSSR